ncbi:MAG: MarR family transcriptional regulator [Pseudonocardiales bacterium]
MLALQRATHATLHALTSELVSLHFTGSEINTIANLTGGPRTVTELAAATGSRPSTLTSVLDRLEGRGQITRGSRRGDRRAVVVELTATGRRSGLTIRQALDALERRALGAMPAAQKAALRAGLQALTEVSA